MSRSAHTILTSGIDIFTGLDANGAKSTEQAPQMFSLEDMDSIDELDTMYKSATNNKSSVEAKERTPMQKIVWYATIGWIFCNETITTIVLVYHIGSLWIIFVPISILVILGIFFLLRTRLDVLQTENVKSIL